VSATVREVDSRAPIRGAQSFVGVMTEVWGRPSLTGLEIAWRWAAGAPILGLVAWRVLVASGTVHVDTAALEAMTVFKPVAAFGAIHAAVAAVLPAAKPVAMWLLPLAAVLWLVMAAVGRTLVLKRFDKTLHARPMTLLVLGMLRAALLTGAWGLWVWVVLKAGAIAITGPAAAGGEPDVVLYSAMLICGTLLVYVLWGLLSWPFQLAPLLAMQRDLGAGASLRVALRSTAARGKLIEVNLVMSIVKIAVLVLGMVFSACPLPFANVESQMFLTCWWAGVVLVYLAALDYFHVVHEVAHLWLWRAYDFPDSGRSRAA
jgi:hypothetical protein